MSTVYTEGTHPGEFIVSEANAGGAGVSRSREAITIAISQTLVAGAVLGVVTASGEYAEHDPAAVNGLEVAAGVLFDAVTTDGVDTANAVALVRDCEVNASELTWITGISAPQLVTAGDELLAIGVIQRVAG